MSSRPGALGTGASSGIGLDLARCLARSGSDLVIVARREAPLAAAAAELQAIGAPSVTSIPADLARPDERRRLLDTLHRSAIHLGVLVNNAGFGGGGAFAETKLADELAMIELNVAAPTELTKALLPAMLARRAGRILNVASVAAFQPGPYMSVYYATKAYVLSWSEALAEELDGSGVTVTTLCPGPTATGFAARARMRAARFLGREPMMSAAAVARAGYEGMLRGERLVVPGATNRLAVTASRLLPRGLVTRLGRRLNEGRSESPER